MKNDLSKMSCLDIYVSGLSDEKYQEIKKDVHPSKDKRMPLLSWDIFNQENSKRNNAISRAMDIEDIKSLAKKYHWKNDIDAIFENNDFEAIVLTDHKQRIEWVNDGFTKMTGYSKKFAIHKSPHFLQGERTLEKSKEIIRSKIKTGKPFKEVIINYRKDNSTYKCEVKIFPLYNEATTHYIALERKVV